MALSIGALGLIPPTVIGQKIRVWRVARKNP